MSKTNAAHACGHHCQIAQMIAVGQSLNDPEVLKGLSGKIVLVAVPAEENIEVEKVLMKVSRGFTTLLIVKTVTGYLPQIISVNPRTTIVCRD